ncbi:MAG: phage tail tape measure protein [Thermoguttaceae bacterium]|nr:phage tail tape measure protein [Thermoguttaceae bacterium]
MASTTAIRAGRAFVELFTDNSKLVRGLREAETRVRDFGNKMKTLGMQLAALGGMAAVPLGIATKVFADFDDQMRAVSAVTGATEADFESLTEKAKLLGRTTSYTASQVAGAMLELGRAGFDPTEIDAAIAGMLDLARATGTDLAEATIYAGNTLRSFNLPATEMTRVCDVLVATANNSAQTLTDLGESMSYCAPIAAEYGLSLEETAKALGSLANYGIKGSQAGTTLRRILTNLADPKIQKQLAALKVNVVDGNTGQLRDVSTILRELGQATENMSKDKKLGLFKELFGLYAIAGGAKLTTASFDKLYNAVDNATGKIREFSKVDIQNVRIELQQTGFNEKEIDTVTASIIDLAKATDSDLAQAVTSTTSLLKTFALSADQSGRVADVLTATANASGQSLNEIGNAMKAVAPSASAFGLSLEDTAKSVGKGVGLTKKQLTELAKAIDSSQGLASKQAKDGGMGAAAKTAKRMDSGIGGSFRMLLSAVEGIAIAVGDALAPCIQKLADYLTKASEGLASYISKNKELIVTIAKTVAAVIGIGIAILTGGIALLAFAKMIGLIAGSISILAKIALTGFGLIGGALKAIIVTAGALLSVFSAAATGIATALSATFTAVAAVATGLFSAVGATITAILSPVGLAIAAVAALGGACYLVYKNAAAIGQAFTKAFASITDAIKNAASSVGRFFMQFTEFKIVVGLSKMIGSGLGILGNLFLRVGRQAYQAISTIGSVFQTLGKVVVSVGTTLGSGLFKGFSATVGFVKNITGRIVSVILGMAGTTIKGVGSVFSGITGLIERTLTPIASLAGSTFSKIIGVIKPLLNLLKSGIGVVVHFVKSFLIVRTIGTVFSGIATAVGGAVRVFTNIGGTMIKTLFSVVRAIPHVVTNIVRAFMSVPGALLRIFQSIPKMITGSFSFLYGMVRSVVSGIGSILSGVAGFVMKAWSGVASAFTTLFNSLGTIVAGFSNFFVSAFATLGSAVDWLKTQFGNFVAFAGETFSAVAKAIGRGDIEAAIQVVWASLKLIWVKGSTSLIETWYWVVDTLQTAWAACVYTLSELLISSWYGVQEFWTETVYTMSTLWTEFSAGVVTAWKSAEESIAKGIGWIMAKMQGLDPNEMNDILTEQYDHEAKQREAKKTQTLNNIQQQRDAKMASLGAEKKGVLDTLKEDQQRASETRSKTYQEKIAGQEAELKAAQAEYDNAVQKAKEPPETKAETEGSASIIDSITTEVQNVVKNFQANLSGTAPRLAYSTSGTFNPFEAVGGQDNWQRKVMEDSLRVQKEIRDNTRKEDDGMI